MKGKKVKGIFLFLIKKIKKNVKLKKKIIFAKKFKMKFQVEKIREDFPILKEKIYGKDLIYLDNGATTQKPKVVIDKITEHYSKFNANIHRGTHYLSQVSTENYENARKTVQNFINAKNDYEIIFTKGTTDGINLIAYSFGEKFIKENDEIIISAMEHHSNIVPYQILCQRKKAKLKIIKMDKNGVLILEQMDKLITKNTKLISIIHASNTLGTVNPVEKIIKKAHNKNIPVLLDAAQSIQHLEIDVQKLDVDFLVFSGHKIFAPTGIGVLYGKEKFLNEIVPYQSGGDMIKTVTFEKTIYNELPFKFEAGTANYLGAIAMATAINYIENIGIKNIFNYEKKLLNYATKKLSKIDGLKIYGNSDEKTAVISFNIKNIHHSDIGEILDKLGIAIRTGTHCTEPIMDFFGITGTARASFSFYNTFEEIDKLYEGILKAKKMLS